MFAGLTVFFCRHVLTIAIQVHCVLKLNLLFKQKRPAIKREKGVSPSRIVKLHASLENDE